MAEQLVPQDLLLGIQRSLGTGSTGKEDLSVEEKLAIANAKLAEQNKEKLPDNKADEGKDGDETPEEVQAKLDELAKKNETTLTDEEKTYIKEKTGVDPNQVDDEITSTKKVLEENYGISLGEEKFENSPSGLTQLVDKITPLVAEKTIANYFAGNPIMAKLHDHVMVKGLSIDTFIAKEQAPTFKNIDIKEVPSDADDAVKTKLINNYKEVIKLDMLSKGVDADSISELIELAEANGKLFDKAKAAKESMVKNHQALVESKIEAERQQKEVYDAKMEENYQKALVMFEKNDFDGLSIPVSDIKAFKQAAFGIDGQGKTAIDKRRETMTIAEVLMVDYLLFKNFKLPTVFTPKTAKAAVKPFSWKQAATDNDQRGGGRLRGAGGTNTSGKEVNIKSLLGQ